MKLHLTIAVAFLLCLQINGQQLNVEITENTTTPYLLGRIDKSGLESDNYNTWFSKNYEDYVLNEGIIKQFASELKEYDITLFMGTWCGDSKREVPRFYKILEACKFSMDQLTVVALSRQADMYKQSPQHEEAGLNIHRVPTFIFYKDGKEVNRIVEEPVQSLEDDILEIVTDNDYKSNYYIVTEVENILKSEGLTAYKKEKRNLYKRYKNKLESIYALNTYAHILYTTERQDEAIAVLKLNTELFPKESYTYISLASKLLYSGNTKKALKYFKKAQKLDPENEQIQKSIEAIKSN